MKKEILNKLIPLHCGITLISLIITIILLLILAGVALNFTIGENGIFKLAENASKNYMNAQNKELSNLENLYSQIKIATNDDAKITISVEDLKTLIKEESKKNNVDYSKEGNIVTETKTVSVSKQSWVHNIQGPTLDAGTWIIFAETTHNGNKWTQVGIKASYMPDAFTSTSYSGCISTSGYYSGDSTNLSGSIYNGDDTARTFIFKFKAIKISDTF